MPVCISVSDSDGNLGWERYFCLGSTGYLPEKPVLVRFPAWFLDPVILVSSYKSLGTSPTLWTQSCAYCCEAHMEDGWSCGWVRECKSQDLGSTPSSASPCDHGQSHFPHLRWRWWLLSIQGLCEAEFITVCQELWASRMEVKYIFVRLCWSLILSLWDLSNWLI